VFSSRRGRGCGARFDLRVKLPTLLFGQSFGRSIGLFLREYDSS
jgi:hypothetical protein